MHDLIEQIDESLRTRLYYLSLFGALSVPDIAGALESNDGQASGAKYSAWYERWARPRYEGNPLTGDACYRFRCSLLHQGSSQHPKSPFDRIIFVEPGSPLRVHYSQMDDALVIDLPWFCSEVTTAARMWLDHVKSDPRFTANLERFAHRRHGGLFPYIVGVPVVG